MNIWLVTIGEPIPHPDNNLRLHRTGIIAKYIAESTEHKITWWTSDFNHFTKSHIYGCDTEFNPSQNLNVIALNGKGYSKNISIDRILDHNQITRKFVQYSQLKEKPDVIVSAFPTLSLCEACIDLGKLWNIPVLLDYRDMWPEVFVDIVPKIAKPFVKFLLRPLFLKTDSVFRKATGIIGITDEFLKLGLNKTNRIKNDMDAVFPLAYLSNQFNTEQLNIAKLFWENLIPKSRKVRISFLGTLGHQFDLETIVSAVQILNANAVSDFEIILCGSGDKKEFLTSAAKNLNGLYLPGYMSAAQIKALLLTSDIGLCPYHLNKAFLSSIPGKAIEYISSGLPILTTLKDGELGKLCNEHGYGFYYEHGNPVSLACEIEKIINIKTTLSDKKKDILQVFNDKFDAKQIYSNYIAHIENVVIKYNAN